MPACSRRARHAFRDGRLVAQAHVERVDATQVRERTVGDGRLAAAPHDERVDAALVRERTVRDGHLTRSCQVTNQRQYMQGANLARAKLAYCCSDRLLGARRVRP